ncbi:MAG: M28 family peptidase [Halofilum sp. (in: g-proteobacteria)]|nr:M28 family peptidase [Halofilum sp. (in: g-proteobacteria)]
MTSTSTTEDLRADAGALCRDIGERTLDTGLAAAERWLQRAFEAAGLAVERQEYAAWGAPVANLVVHLGPAGDDPLVIGAHYDTVPGTEGADDNGSSVCVLLALARRLARRPPSIPLRLVAFTLEEEPAFGTANQGSRVFVQRMREAGERPRGAIVLEMVGYTAATQAYPAPLRRAGYPETGDFIGIVANRRSRHLMRDLSRGLRRHPDLPVETLVAPCNGWLLPDVRLSDHSSFWDARWPAVMVTDTAYFRNPNYHRPSDRIETLDFDFMARLVNSLDLAVETLGGRG